MTGLIKPKNYDWKDSNLALFGSDIDKLVKKESATKEPAWKDAGKKVGLQIWRIVDFVVTTWKKQDHGKFYNGDSYIILNTYNPSPDSDELAFDVHFWIGSRSTQDEYGTAAYKTVELDTYLDGRPVQHREVEGFESDQFRSYFPKGLTIMEGGADTGFNIVQPTKYEPRLFHFSGTRKDIVVREVPRARSRIVSDDVFILDLGLKMYQWNGKGSNKDERFKALQYLAQLKSERGKAVSDTLEEEDTPSNHEFYEALTRADEVDKVAQAFMIVMQKSKPVTKLYRLAEQGGGHLELTKVKEGKLSKSDFDSNDVFLVDTGRECFVWLGKGTSPNEVQNGFGMAHASETIVQTTGTMQQSETDLAECPEDEVPSKKRKPNTNTLKCSIISCDESFGRMRQVIEHLNKVHHQNLEVQHLKFSSEAEFDEWIRDVERSALCNFLRGGVQKWSSPVHVYYYCNRSGTSRRIITEPRKRHLKVQGYSKINRTCPAHIIKHVTQEGISVDYYAKHLCHTDTYEQLGHVRLSVADREWLAGKLALQIPLDAILRDVRKTLDGQLTRLHIVTKQDLTNIEKAFHLNKPERHHEDDATSVTAFVKSYDGKDNSPILAYKQQGAEDFDILPEGVYAAMPPEDFLFAMMDSSQCQMLQNQGNAIELTRLVNPVESHNSVGLSLFNCSLILRIAVARINLCYRYYVTLRIFCSSRYLPLVFAC